MRLFFILLFALALFGVFCGIIALFRQALYASAFLVPSSIYISAFLLAYVLEENQRRATEHRHKRERTRLKHTSRRPVRDDDNDSDED